MVDVPENLAPRDGLTNARIKFDRLLAPERGSGATVVFAMRDEDGREIGEHYIEVGPTKAKTIDSMVARAHREMIDVLRQWIHELDVVAKAFEKREG